MKATVVIEGMMCGMCEAHMNDAIRRVLPAAKKVKSSHKKGVTTFETEDVVDEELIKNVVEETGYTFVSVSFDQ
ncbi:MAG: heavy-metal-associated domain-containing protein [Eubacterium sp.]|nr:heavy-metal-associated domain-containing protein [Eubacterium sp.]